MPDTIQIQVRIERKTKYGDYHDAIYFTPDEFFDKNGKRKITDEQIESQAQQRVKNHERRIEEVRLLPPAPPATEQELFGWMSNADIAKFEAWKASRLAGGG